MEGKLWTTWTVGAYYHFFPKYSPLQSSNQGTNFRPIRSISCQMMDHYRPLWYLFNNLADIMQQFIQSLPAGDDPEVFGLDSSAVITFLNNETKVQQPKNQNSFRKQFFEALGRVRPHSIGNIDLQEAGILETAQGIIFFFSSLYLLLQQSKIKFQNLGMWSKFC